ncbi:MAG: YbaN family protein [Sarcina sp.]
MKNISKILYVSIGMIALALGMVGVILPMLPTTPFLLLASFCFVRGSERFDKWFKGTKIYKKHLDSFVRERAMTLKQKIVILTVADTMIAIPLILVDNNIMRTVLILVILFKFYYFIFRIKTIKVCKSNVITK